MFDKGRTIDLNDCTVDECVSLLLRYLLRLPDAVIPCAFYDRFHDPSLLIGPIGARTNTSEHIKLVSSLIISELPWQHKHLLLYLLDLFAFLAHARESASLFAEIFHTAILKPPKAAFLLPGMEENRRNESVVTFLVEHAAIWLSDFKHTQDKNTNDGRANMTPAQTISDSLLVMDNALATWDTNDVDPPSPTNSQQFPDREQPHSKQPSKRDEPSFGRWGGRSSWSMSSGLVRVGTNDFDENETRLQRPTPQSKRTSIGSKILRRGEEKLEIYSA
jgi:hypothetical protein